MNKTKETIISRASWTESLADAIDAATEETVIVVHSDAQEELGYLAASRMGKTVEIVVREDTEE